MRGERPPLFDLEQERVEVEVAEHRADGLELRVDAPAPLQAGKRREWIEGATPGAEGYSSMHG
jgi:hypothetical protein